MAQDTISSITERTAASVKKILYFFISVLLIYNYSINQKRPEPVTDL